MKLLKFYFRYFTFRSLRKVRNIKAVIKSHGFRIHPYRLEETDSQITELIRELGCEDLAQRENGFVVTNEVIKAVFIRKNLSTNDQLEILFHEEAHIWCNHLNTANFTDQTAIQKEVEAQRFYPRLKALRRVVILLTITALAIGAFFLTPQASRSVVDTEPVGVSGYTIITNGNPNDIVYITGSGDAYHREYCGTIAGSHTRTETTRSSAESLGRHPCSYCNP